MPNEYSNGIKQSIKQKGQGQSSEKQIEKVSFD
jgi:hypothetical protein